MNDAKSIAEGIIYAESKDGYGFQIRMAVGPPYLTKSGSWACPVEIEGLHDRLHDIHGDNSWQALILAIGLVKVLLGFFIEDGGKLFWEQGGEEMSLNDLFWDEDSSGEPEVPQPDEPMTPEEQALVSALTADDLHAIDEAILSNCSEQSLKVARVVGSVMDLDELANSGLTDSFFAQRIYRLVESGKLISDGKLGYMRFCEVRLPTD